MKDYYGRLGLTPGASEEEVRSAWRRAAKRLHPDVGGDPAEFRAAFEAYTVLSDPAARASFDHGGGWSADWPDEGWTPEDWEQVFTAMDRGDRATGPSRPVAVAVAITMILVTLLVLLLLPAVVATPP